MFRIARRFLPVASVIASLFVVATGRAQSSNGTIEGTITDPSGAVVANAHVHITAQLTGVSRDLTTSRDGLYAAPNLSAGRYKVTVTAPGFATKSENDVVLSVGGIRDVDIAMAITGTETIVNVESSSNQVNPVDTSVQGVVDGKQTRDLPLNGRDYTTLATLNTGVSQILTQFAGAATATTRLSRGLGAQLTIGGNRPQGNSYRLDGININDYANGGPGSVSGSTLGVDAVQEFNVITSDAPAQFGRMSGGVINSITRQGTNALHGSVYDFVRNSVFDSRGYFDPPSGEPSFRRNQFGATIGGPIIHDKTFFFFNYEGFRQAQGISLQSTVLSPAARSGVVTCTQPALPAAPVATCKTNPDGTGPTVPQPAAGQPAAPGYQNVGVDAKVAPYLSLYPLPNGNVTGNTGVYNFQTTTKTNEDLSTIHLDHNFAQSDSLHGTLLYNTASLDSADQTNTLYDEAISRRTTGVLEEIHIFSPRLSNSFRVGLNRSVAIAPLQKAVINPAVNNPALSYYAGRSVGQVLVSSLTTIQGGSGAVGTSAYHANFYQLYDDATYIIGKHSLTFGGVVEYDQTNALGGVLPNGEWNFGSVSGFLTNTPTFFEGVVPGTPVVPHDLRQNIYGAYVQDSWKLRPNLTANLGLRYEMATNFTETAGRLGSLPTPTSAVPVAVNSFFSTNPTTKNFEPRLGVAWDVYGNGKTVVTAASGIYDALPLSYTFLIQIVSSAPSYDEGRVTYAGSTGKGLFPSNPFLTTTPKLRDIYTPQAPPRSYVIQNSVNLQQQITQNTVFTLGYIGSHGVHQVFTTNDINNVPFVGQDAQGNYFYPDQHITGAARSALQLNPAAGTISDTIYAGSSLYHSLQSSLSYAAKGGFTGKISYTWSHSIDISSSALSGASFGNSVSGLPAFDLRLDRGDSDFDLRNVFSANAVAPIYDIKRGGAYTSVLRHWTVSNIFNARGGIPFTPIVGGDALGLLGSQTFQFPDRVVYNRPCTNKHNVVNYIDQSCFAAPGMVPYGAGLSGPRLGTSRRNTLQGPGLFFWQAGLMKEQSITERVRAQFQAQAFNVINHTNFANPASAQTQIYGSSASSTTGLVTYTPSASAGGLSATATSSRQLQFSLKVLF